MLTRLLACFKPHSEPQPAPGPPEAASAPPIPVTDPPANLPLPPELVLKSIELLVAGREDGREEIQASLDALRAVCLTSRWCYQVAFPLLYRHVFLPSQARIERFILTVESAAWAEAQRRGEVRGLVKSVWVRRDESEGGGSRYCASVDAELVGRLLGGLDQAGITSLRFDNLVLHRTNMAQLTGLERLESSKGIVHGDRPRHGLSLPSLTTIILDDAVFVWDHDGRPDVGPASLLSPTVVPNLVSLAIRNRLPHFHRRAALAPAFLACLGQLDTLSIDGNPEWVFPHLPPFYASLNKVKHLATAEHANIVQEILRCLPSSLGSLDLSLPAPVEVYKDPVELEFDWDSGWTSVRSLERVVLPAKERWLDDPRAAKPASWLNQVEAAARAQGVKVEFR